MAPARNTKPVEYNPWGWVIDVSPDQMVTMHLYRCYRIIGYHTCKEPKRNCKRNPYCVWGLGEKKWKEEGEGDNEDDQVAFRTEGEYAGIQNLGATCYVNSLLQLWFHNPIFRPAILKWTPSVNPEELDDYKPKCPLAQLQAIFARLKISKRSKINPSEFVSSLQLNTGEQQDAQEFAKLFMDYIVKLLSDYGNEYIKKLIAQSFNGQLQYETECLGCNNKTRRPEAFTEFILSVKKNLGESLDELLADEIISEYMCSNCQKKNTAKRRMQLLTLPPILNLQLLRFVYDREAQRRKKVTQAIQFPEVLNLQEKMFQENPATVVDPLKYKYHLTAALIHNGPSASSGHYIAQIKDLKTGEWLKFNDEFVDPLNRGKTQKPKDEDSGSDDGDKKSKSKKQKNTPSLSSAGAYMLVYTSEECINNRENDPDLHKYLIDLVRREDASFEEEVTKSKNEKDYELAEKNQRRKEVEWLYGFGQFNKTLNGNDTPDSDAENQEGPKAKMARMDLAPNSVEMDTSSSQQSQTDSEGKSNNLTKKDGEKMNNNGHKTNGISTEYPVLPPRKKEYSIVECDFVSVEWISQWLDPGNPVPPIENLPLLCEHKKLAPPTPNHNPCPYRIIPSPLADVWYEHYSGSPRITSEDLCEICAKAHCKRLRALAQLEEDFKLVNDLIKKYEAANLSVNRSEPLADDGRNACWITKENLKSWKKLAREIIEGPMQGNSKKVAENNGHGSEAEEVLDEDDEVTSTGPFNADIMCIHGNLSPDQQARKAIPMTAWNIIAKYFKDPFTIEDLKNESCPDCRDQEHANTVAVQQNKDFALRQKSELSDLFSDRNRPEVDSPKELFIIPSSFVTDWKRFVRDPVRHDPVRELKNASLICEHGGFMYPFNLVMEYLKCDESHDDIVKLITPAEWKTIQGNFDCDREIKMTVNNPDLEEGIEYTPNVCAVCAQAWLERAYSKQFEYNECPIYIVKREKGDNNADSDDDEPAKDPKESQPQSLGKREVRPTNPNAWMQGLSNTVRRSHRPRSSKSERTYKVNSTMTIKELKSKICADFKTLLSDQHLFYQETELTDLAKTLRDYKIPGRAKLYLEIDTAENGSIEDMVATVETGFQGTLLIGGNSNFGDTQSPVQNI